MLAILVDFSDNLTGLYIARIITSILGTMAIYLAFSLFVSWNQRKLNGIQIIELGLQDEEGIQIKVFSEIIYELSSGYSLTHRAMLYIRNDFIFIGPRLGDWYTGFYRFHLPIVFTRIPIEVKARTKINNIYSPISMQPGDGELVEIVFKEVQDHPAETSLYIEFCDAKDYEKLKPHFFSASG